MAVGRWLPILFLCLSAPAWAVPPATVEAVQAPAWRERAGQKEPLAPGMELRHGDRISTGEGARAYLKLAEGSTVKLGESAALGFYSRSLQPRSAFKGALDVATGAFRFTTDLLRRVRSREVSIRVGTATVGIRGTDVWGRTDKEKDLVCLIEGKIEVAHPLAPEPVAMTEAMSFFVAPNGATPQPVAPVDPAQLEQWARETEIEPGDGAVRRGGRWALLLGEAAGEADALALYDKARTAGFAARVRVLAGAEGGWIYRVLVPGFASEVEAQAAAGRLMKQTGLEARPGR